MSWWPRREEAHPRRRAEGSRGGHLREVPMRQEERQVAVPSRLAALREEVRGHPAVAPTRVLGGCRSSPCSSPGRWLKTDGISDGWSQREARIRQQHLQLELDQN